MAEVKAKPTAATHSWCGVRSAMMPPTSTPAALNSRKPDRPMLATAAGVSCRAPRADDREGLDAAIGHGDADEEQQVAQDRAAQQQVEADLGAGQGVLRQPHAARQDAAGHDQQQGRDDRQPAAATGRRPASPRRRRWPAPGRASRPSRRSPRNCGSRTPCRCASRRWWPTGWNSRPGDRRCWRARGRRRPPRRSSSAAAGPRP